MSTSPRDRALEELRIVATGERGSSQNLFRSILFNRFQNFYGSDPDPSLTTRQSVIDHCIATVRGFDPLFQPRWVVVASLGMTWEVQAPVAASAALPAEVETVARKLADAAYSLQWLRLAEGGAWMLRAFDAAGECVDISVHDDPEEALLAVAESLLP